METFDAAIKRDEGGRLTVIELPFNPRVAFGRPRGAIRVAGAIEGTPYRGKLLSRGGGRMLLVVDKALQKALGYGGGEMRVRVNMKLDEVSEMANGPERFEDAGALQSGAGVLEAIERRRSIRRYTGTPVDDAMLKAVLYAGLCAPTAVNKRPYHFVLLKERAQLARLAEASTYARMLAQAACGIVVCGDRNIEGRAKFLYEDCAAAIQNMLLAIHGLGLGGVWCGVTPGSDWAGCLTAELGTPPKVEPVAVIALGWPGEEREPPPMWEPEKIHHGRW